MEDILDVHVSPTLTQYLSDDALADVLHHAQIALFLEPGELGILTIQGLPILIENRAEGPALYAPTDLNLCPRCLEHIASPHHPNCPEEN